MSSEGFPQNAIYTDLFTLSQTRGLRNSLNNVSSVESGIGIQSQELDQLDAIGADRKLANAQAKSALVDTDWVPAISSYIMQQASLQAAYTAYQDMQGMSLFQINR